MGANMILGLSVPTFTLLHVILSLIGIGAGIVVFWGLVQNDRLPAWTGVFLLTTVLTSVTGFFFHSKAFGPPHIFGVISLIVLAAALVARYRFDLRGGWRSVYVLGALIALYLNCVVGIIQFFQKFAFLRPLAPTQSEPPFLAAQLATLALFLVFGFLAVRRFDGGAAAASIGRPQGAR